MNTPTYDHEVLNLRRLYDVVKYWQEKTPEIDAWRFKNEHASYARLLADVRTFAKALLASGVRPGDRVAMLSTPRPWYWTSFLATASIGGIWVGLNPRYRLRELSYVANDSEPCLLFGIGQFESRDYVRDLQAVVDSCPSVKRLVVLDGVSSNFDAFLSEGHDIDDSVLDQRIATVDGRDASLLVYTSGTTGSPKGALLSQWGLCRRFGRTSTEIWPRPLRMVANLPINHVGGVGEHGCGPLMAGGTIVFQERFDPSHYLATVEQHQLTALLLIPTMFKMLTEHEQFEHTDFSSVQLAIWGGGACSERVITTYRNRGIALKGMFGITETATALTFTRDGASDEVLSHTTGAPVAEYSVQLRDSEDHVVKNGEVGEVVLDNSDVWLGYYKRPEDTRAARTKDGLYKTGDLAILRPDGNLTVVGRIKEMFKSGGYNIYPREVELVLEAHPEVRAAVVVGVPDAHYGESGVAYIEAVPGSSLAADELSAWCHSELANYKVPHRFEFLDTLPLLPNSKVDRKRLRDMAIALA